MAQATREAWIVEVGYQLWDGSDVELVELYGRFLLLGAPLPVMPGHWKFSRPQKLGQDRAPARTVTGPLVVCRIGIAEVEEPIRGLFVRRHPVQCLLIRFDPGAVFGNQSRVVANHSLRFLVAMVIRNLGDGLPCVENCRKGRILVRPESRLSPILQGQFVGNQKVQIARSLWGELNAEGLGPPGPTE
jgi:hypothetical protein